MKRLLILALSLLVFSIDLRSQTNDELFAGLNYSIPPSPNASAIAEFTSVPVNLYTGIPEIGVPFPSIQSRTLSLPIAINYHAGGNKVDEVASNIGLGWSLSAGGVISRTTYGLPDDEYNGGYLGLPPIPEPSTSSYNDYYAFATGSKDSQPDIFNISVGGNSSHFFFKKEGEHPNTEIDVMFVPDNGNNLIKVHEQAGGKIGSWVYTDERGIKYYFEAQEETDVTNQESPVTRVSKHVTSWYLTKMVNAQQTDSIKFIYQTYESDYSLRPSVIYKENALVSDQTSVFEITGKKISEIQYIGGKVVFSYHSQSRCDMEGNEPLERVDYYANDKLIKSFILHHDYSTPTGTRSYFAPCAVGSRLRLKKITQVDSLDQELLLREFQYSNKHLPVRLSSAQDHWGFYNGKTSNTDLIPGMRVGTSYEGNHFNYKNYLGADREASSAHAIADILEKVKFPTGGWKTFTYEANTCESPELPNVLNLEDIIFSEGSGNQSMSIDLINQPFSVVTILPTVINFEGVDCQVRITITGQGINDSWLFNNESLMNSQEIFLPEGSYTISHQIVQTGCTSNDNYSFKISWENENAIHNKVVGGLRVSEIEVYDPVSTDTLIIFYDYTDENGYSTGVLNTIPIYGYFKCDNYPFRTFYRTASSNVNLDFSQGSPVGYRQVTEIRRSEVENGKKIHAFYSALENPDQSLNPFMALYQLGIVQGSNPDPDEYSYMGFTWAASHTKPIGFPFVPVDSKSWARGLAKYTEVYDGDGNMVAKDEYDYFLLGVSVQSQVSWQESSYGIACGLEQGNAGEIVIYNDYKLTNGNLHPYIQNKKQYYGYDSITSAVQYAIESDKNLLLKRSETNSDGQYTYKKEYVYLEDLDLSATAGSDSYYNALKISYEDYRYRKMPVEVVTCISKDGGTNYEFLSSQLIEYGDFNGKIYPKARYRLTRKGLSGTFSKLSTSGNTLVWNNDYMLEQTIIEYDVHGNPIKLQGIDGTISRNTFDSIYHKYLIKQEVLDENDNVISEVEYEHKQGFGLSHVMDQNDRIEEYEYDPFGRLMTVKDDDDNIIKAYRYKYSTEN